jgi:hypothetical protein
MSHVPRLLIVKSCVLRLHKEKVGLKRCAFNPFSGEISWLGGIINRSQRDNCGTRQSLRILPDTVLSDSAGGELDLDCDLFLSASQLNNMHIFVERKYLENLSPCVLSWYRQQFPSASWLMGKTESRRCYYEAVDWCQLEAVLTAKEAPLNVIWRNMQRLGLRILKSQVPGQLCAILFSAWRIFSVYEIDYTHKCKTILTKASLCRFQRSKAYLILWLGASIQHRITASYSNTHMANSATYWPPTLPSRSGTDRLEWPYSASAVRM